MMNKINPEALTDINGGAHAAHAVVQSGVRYTSTQALVQSGTRYESSGCLSLIPGKRSSSSQKQNRFSATSL